MIEDYTVVVEAPDADSEEFHVVTQNGHRTEFVQNATGETVFRIVTEEEGETVVTFQTTFENYVYHVLGEVEIND